MPVLSVICLIFSRGGQFCPTSRPIFLNFFLQILNQHLIIFLSICILLQLSLFGACFKGYLSDFQKGGADLAPPDLVG